MLQTSKYADSDTPDVSSPLAIQIALDLSRQLLLSPDRSRSLQLARSLVLGRASNLEPRFLTFQCVTREYAAAHAKRETETACEQKGRGSPEQIGHQRDPICACGNVRLLAPKEGRNRVPHHYDGEGVPTQSKHLQLVLNLSPIFSQTLLQAPTYLGVEPPRQIGH